MTKAILTQKYIKSILEYKTDSGGFYWRKSGKAAGTVDRYGYLQIGIKGGMYLAHRLAFLYVNGAFPEYQVDHLNQNKLDNRWSNLADVTQSMNQRNRPMQANNTSGAVGVSWNKVAKKWQAAITVNGKSKHIGLYAKKVDAIAARKAAESKHGFHKNHGRKKELPGWDWLKVAIAGELA